MPAPNRGQLPSGHSASRPDTPPHPRRARHSSSALRNRALTATTWRGGLHSAIGLADDAVTAIRVGVAVGAVCGKRS